MKYDKKEAVLKAAASHNIHTVVSHASKNNISNHARKKCKIISTDSERNEVIAITFLNGGNTAIKHGDFLEIFSAVVKEKKSKMQNKEKFEIASNTSTFCDVDDNILLKKSAKNISIFKKTPHSPTFFRNQKNNENIYNQLNAEHSSETNRIAKLNRDFNKKNDSLVSPNINQTTHPNSQNIISKTKADDQFIKKTSQQTSFKLLLNKSANNCTTTTVPKSDISSNSALNRFASIFQPKTLETIPENSTTDVVYNRIN